MKGTKTLLIAGAVATVGMAGVIGSTMASAESANNSSGIVEKIASKFSLKEADVQAVFDEEHTERQAERAAEMSDRLQDAVDNGDITAEQKKLIEAKIAENQKEREAERTALQQWADENNIDMRYVMGGRHGNGNRLANAVEDGDITADQKKLIEAKQAELEKSRDAHHDEMEQWAEDNGIDMENIGGFGERRGGHGGPGRGAARE